MKHKLASLRADLDATDAQLIKLLARRFKISHQVGLYKIAHSLAPVDAAREASMLKSIASQASQAKVNPELAQAILRLIINEVVKNHKALSARSKVNK